MKARPLYTRNEFETLRKRWAEGLVCDKAVQDQALDLLVKADRHNWIHQTNWFGEPILQLPQDVFTLQEIIFRTRPRFIIEVGVAWGGSLLFYSTLMHALGGERVIGIDVYIPDDLRARLERFGPLSERITLIQGSSVDPRIVEQVRAIVGDCRQNLVHLDSLHSHAHVLQELKLYSPFVGKGSYLICGDTVVERMPEQTHRPRPWGPGNSPQTACAEFLRSTDEFEVDREFEAKYLFSCNPGGYLRRVRA